MSDAPPPLAYRLLLGPALRTFRERAGLTADEVATALGWYMRKVALVESGQRKLALAEAERLVELYRLEPSERDQVLTLAAGARRRDNVSPPVAGWAQECLAIEAAATQMRIFQEELLPGVLQSEGYARALLSTASQHHSGGVEGAVSVRLARQERLMRFGGPDVHLVLGEAAVRRLVGGRDVMRHQLSTLLEYSAAGRIKLQVLPLSAGEHIALGTSFALLDVGEPATTFAHTETFVDGRWYDTDNYVNQFASAFQEISAKSLDQSETRALLQHVLEGIEE